MITGPGNAGGLVTLLVVDIILGVLVVVAMLVLVVLVDLRSSSDGDGSSGSGRWWSWRNNDSIWSNYSAGA